MKQKLLPRRIVITLTGLLFAAYSAYNIFVIVRNKAASAEVTVISAIVALVFGILAVFAWTTEVKNMRFIRIRSTAFIVVILTIVALKLRLAGSVIEFLNFTDTLSVLYCGAYFLTVVALLYLLVFYAFILNRLSFRPWASAFLPLFAIALFLCCLVLEAIMFFAFGIGLEDSPLRTLVSRPLFYLGFIGLSAYFLFAPQELEDQDGAQAKKIDETDFRVSAEHDEAPAPVIDETDFRVSAEHDEAPAPVIDETDFLVTKQQDDDELPKIDDKDFYF